MSLYIVTLYVSLQDLLEFKFCAMQCVLHLKPTLDAFIFLIHICQKIMLKFLCLLKNDVALEQNKFAKMISRGFLTFGS